MSNPFDEVRTAVNTARLQFQAVDEAANSMAQLLRGRLRKVDSKVVLTDLKRELQDFDSRTGVWKK
jgi:predicted transcriptional regulator